MKVYRVTSKTRSDGERSMLVVTNGGIPRAEALAIEVGFEPTLIALESTSCIVDPELTGKTVRSVESIIAEMEGE